jgi:hypothetical protein
VAVEEGQQLLLMGAAAIALRWKKTTGKNGDYSKITAHQFCSEVMGNIHI